MSKSADNLNSVLTDIANSIRNASESSEALCARDFADTITTKFGNNRNLITTLISGGDDFYTIDLSDYSLDRIKPHAFHNDKNITSFKITGVSSGGIGESAFDGCENITYLDLGTINGPLGEFALSGLTSVEHFNLNADSNITDIGAAAFWGLGQAREGENRFTLDFRNSTFEAFRGFSYTQSTCGIVTIDYSISNFDIYLPETLKYLGTTKLSGTSSWYTTSASSVLQGSSNVDLYFARNNLDKSITLASIADLPLDDKSHTFIPYDDYGRVKQEANWILLPNLIGYKLFAAGALLPTTDTYGYEVNWFSDKDCTQLINAGNGSTIYCKTTWNKLKTRVIKDFIEGCTIDIIDTSNNHYDIDTLFDIGTTVTIRPVSAGACRLLLVNGINCTAQGDKTVTLDTDNIEVTCICETVSDFPEYLKYEIIGDHEINISGFNDSIKNLYIQNYYLINGEQYKVMHIDILPFIRTSYLYRLILPTDLERLDAKNFWGNNTNSSLHFLIYPINAKQIDRKWLRSFYGVYTITLPETLLAIEYNNGASTTTTLTTDDLNSNIYSIVNKSPDITINIPYYYNIIVVQDEESNPVKEQNGFIIFSYNGAVRLLAITLLDKKLIIPANCTDIKSDLRLENTILEEIDFTANQLITEIPNYFISYCPQLRVIKLPAQLTRICSEAFSYSTASMPNLQAVYYPLSLSDWFNARIGIASWGNQGSTSMSLWYNNNAILYCNNVAITGELVIPDDITVLNGAHFCNYSHITNIIFNNYISSQVDSAIFYGTNLDRIVVPQYMYENYYISSSTFGWDSQTILYTNSSNVTVPTKSGDWYVLPIGSEPIIRNNFEIVETDEDTVYILKYYGTDSIVTLSDNLSTKANYQIQKRCFANNQSIVELTLSAKVTELAAYAISGCQKLNSLVITEPNSSIATYSQAVYSCYNLENITYTGTLNSWIMKIKSYYATSGNNTFDNIGTDFILTSDNQRVPANIH